MFGILGSTCAFFGIGLLYFTWQSKTSNNLFVMGGWTLIIGSLVFWRYTNGADKGIALGIVVFSLISLLFLTVIALSTPPRKVKPLRERTLQPPPNNIAVFLKRFWSGLLIGPLSGFSALLFSTAIFAISKASLIEHTINLTVSAFLFPLSWAVLAVCVGCQTLIWKKSLTVFFAALISAASLWFAI